MTRVTDRDEALLAAARASSPTPRPTSATTARRARALEQAIARHAERQHRAIPRRTVAITAFLVAGAASATTALLVGVGDERAFVAPEIAPDAAPVTSTDGTRAHVRAIEPALDVSPTPARALAVAAPSTTSTTASTTSTSTSTATSTATRPQFGAPAKKRSHADPTPTASPSSAVDDALSSSTAAAPSLASGASTADDEPAAVVVDVQDVGEDAAHEAVAASVEKDRDDDGVREARVLRDRCIDGLRARRDRGALDDCRVFGQRFPAHPAARALAFGAGGLAEELGMPREAIAAYSRAILLSPLVGSTWDDALLARARLYADVGELDEARADLRIYLHRSPEAIDNADVARLRSALHLEQ
jgi:tetratricopeptide (TPR) repeat protein